MYLIMSIIAVRRAKLALLEHPQFPLYPIKPGSSLRKYRQKMLAQSRLSNPKVRKNYKQLNE